ncbi:hypothetical protein [Viridibacterium curvum]|uniref:Uncharacterized protein n=1 Tax=Viridibacterium curvum TaxID=1101404 RepID=A0ABP9QM17_9RHOO
MRICLFHVLFVLCGLMVSGMVQAAEEPLPRWQADAALRESMAASLDGRWVRFFEGDRPRLRVQSADLADYVLDAVAIGHRPERTLRVLQGLSSMIDRDATSRTYGNMHWYYGDTKLVDRNGIEFAMRRLVIAPLVFGDRLDAAQKAALTEVLSLARTGLTRHAVAISYTNIYLMKSWNLIALGEATGDEGLAQQGRTMLRDWLRHTAKTGINEFLSPGYYEVDLDNLALIANLSRDAATRKMAQDGLNYLWHDIALHWFGPGQRLGGVHSRDYDRLLNNGQSFQAKVVEAGWFAPASGKAARRSEDQSPYRYYATRLPSEAARAWLAGPFPRFISQRWGVEPEKRLAHYMGHKVGISSAEAGYTAGHDTAPLAINLGGGADVPIITFLMDGRRDYYGVNKTLEAGSGHMKALHLRPFITSVQNGPDVLFASAIKNDTANNVSLESAFTLPADAEFWLDDQPLQLFNASSAWVQDFAANGESTQIAVSERTGKPVVSLVDEDDKLGVGLSQRFAVEAGKRYRLTAALQGGDVYLYLNFYDAAQRLIGGENALRVTGGQGVAVERSNLQLAPAGAVQCKAWLYSTSTNRTRISVTDLRFEEVAESGAAQRVLGGFDFREFRAEQRAVPLGATLHVRREGVVASLRILGAWDVQGRSIAASLHNDGLSWRAMRLGVVHATGREEGVAAVAAWARVEEGLATEEAFAAYRRHIAAARSVATRDGEVLEAGLDIAPSLRLRADVMRGQRLLREGMTVVPEGAALWVDGKDLARSLLGDYLQD